MNRFEILSALYVLSERPWESQHGEPFPLDLSGLNLRGLNFSDFKFWGSSLRHTDLSNAFLPGARLEGADLYCANLENTAFRMSSLHKTTGPSELGPKLGRANFRNADLKDVKFMDPGKESPTSWLDLDDTCFEGASLEGADISVFDLQKPSGLTRKQIETAASRPPLPENFQPRACQPFGDLCRNASKK